MQVVTQLQSIPAHGGSAVALGYFDGVHLGHRAVMGAAWRWAQQHGATAAVFTFSLPAKNYKGRALLTIDEKERRIAAQGIDTLLCPPAQVFFDFSCEEFVQRILVDTLHAKAVFCGEDFTFGKKAAGNVATLRTLCDAAGILTETVPTVMLEGAPVSSTRIRAALAACDVEEASRLLGDAYTIDLPVGSGRQIGRTMGLPTINQQFPAGMQLPGSGVYITQTLLDGVWHASATGIGTRPTVGGTDISCETFICDFEGDLYGTSPRVRFCAFLKPTVKFDTREQLRVYIEDAAAASRAWTALHSSLGAR